MRRLRAGVLALVSLTALTALTGCTDDGSARPGDPTPASGVAAAESQTATATPTPARPAPRPRARACYRLTYDQAIAPTTKADPVPCRRPHTSVSHHVGTIDAVVDGHLLAVDSRRVQAQVTADCPRRLPRFLGGTPDDLHLSMLRAVWFTPTLEESDAGADWYRCDVIAVAVEGKLAQLAGPVEGVLSRPEGRDRYGMCGTAEPGTDEFSRVICSRPHSWRAIRTVDFQGTKHPGVARVRAAGEAPCEEAARAVASDPTSFRWGYEWPTQEQWAAGQHYGLCWTPDRT